LFFFLVFLVGLSSGATSNFAFLRMRELGASDKLLGACRLLSSMAGAPMFWFSGRIQHYIGAVDRVLVLTLLCYATRFSIYAFMTNHTLHGGLVADVIRGVSFAIFWSTATIYANRIAPPSLGVTMVRIRISYTFCIKSHSILAPFFLTLFVWVSQPILLNAIYSGLGNSIGAMATGSFQVKLGTRQTFLYAAAIDIFFAVFAAVLSVLRKDSNFRTSTPIPHVFDVVVVAASASKKEN
jgi:hypothetical protein